MSVHECVTPGGDPYLAIHMQESWTECTACGAETPARWGLPVWNGMIVANDWPGEWGGVPACESCWERHERGELVEVPTAEYAEISRDDHLAIPEGQKLMPDVRSLRGLLPLELPFPCPICGAKVRLTNVTEWGLDDGAISVVEYECETEPDVDSDDWPDWHRGHYSMPYVDWLPWENRMLTWLNRNYHYRDEPGDVLEAPQPPGTSS